MLKLISILLFINLLSISVKFCNCKKVVLEQYRLPNTTIPIHYDIKIQTEIDQNQNNFQFSGEVKILFKVITSTSEIAIHSKNATILRSELIEINDSTKNNTNILKIEHKYELNKVTEILYITCDTELKADVQYQLQIVYESELREDKLGFYRSSYKGNDNKKTIWLAATQFAPTEARHAFPCYDEPKFKATFQIELVHPKNLFAISNTGVEQNKEVGKNLLSTKFKKTPIMSTYLTSFVISDLSKITNPNQTDGRITHSTYVRSNAVTLTKFAAEFGVLAFTQLYNIFNGERNQPKEISEFKQILIPDCHFSAMENWGAIIYFEQKLFYKESDFNTKSLYEIAHLISHELTHQWFGNTVTPEWWTHVWLNEGFATLYAYYIVAKAHPQWNSMQIYQIDVLHLVFDYDDDTNVRPMTFYVEKQPDIFENYDRIAYEKASCVIRMFDNALGQQFFKKGLDIFFESRKFKSATEDHLFDSLDEAINTNYNEKFNIKETFGNWTHQGGYPLLTIEVLNNTIKLIQQRFLRVGTSTSDSAIWQIPINLEMPQPIGNNFTNTKAQFWMTTQTHFMTIENKLFDKSKHWVIANIQQTGYYRVNYNIENWNLIINALKSNHTEIHVANRAQLIDDAFHLARKGYLQYDILLNLLEYLKNETEYAPWKAFDNGMKFLQSRLISKGNELKNFIHDITQSPFSKFGLQKFDSELLSTSLIRPIIAEYACSANNMNCINYEKPYNTTDLRKIYYCEQLRKYGGEAFTEIKNNLNSIKEFQFQRLDYISILGCANNEHFLRTLLLYTIQDNDDDLHLTKNERSAILQSVYTWSDTGLGLSIDFIKKTWKKLKTTLCEDCLANNIVAMSQMIKDLRNVDEFNELLGEVELNQHYVNKATQNIINNSEWDESYSKVIQNWLTAKKYSSGAAIFIINFNFFILIVTCLMITIY